jgi:hypothetical protein
MMRVKDSEGTRACEGVLRPCASKKSEVRKNK